MLLKKAQHLFSGGIWDHPLKSETFGNTNVDLKDRVKEVLISVASSKGPFSEWIMEAA